MRIIKIALKIAIRKGWRFIDRKAEIKVVKKCDRQGHNYWLAFNPINRSYRCFYSETEVMMWIEQSYYSNHR